MTVLYVPRAGGSTLILTITPSPSVTPTLVVVARFRDGQVNAFYRDGKQQATYRDGIVTTGGR